MRNKLINPFARWARATVILFASLLALKTGFGQAARLAESGGMRVQPASAGAGATSTVVLTFEGLQGTEAVANYYNGERAGKDGKGSGPGPNYGITFNADALASVSTDSGGGGHFQGQPSGNTVLFFQTGSAATMNVAGGFTTGFSFYYSSPFAPGTINVWSGLNSTGTLLTTLQLPATPARTTNPATCTNPSQLYCPWLPLGVQFSGIARSVDFGGTINNIGFDNITLGSSTAAATEITSLSPPSAPAGGSAFTLTVNGSGFTSASTVQWNGGSLSTAFVSATQLRASVPASLISNTGVANITVVTGSGGSNSLPFTIGPPANLPTIVSLSPNTAPAGSNQLQMTVNGSGFLPTSAVQWTFNGQTTPLTAQYITATQLIATVPGNLLITAGTAQVIVGNVSEGAAAISNSSPFTITGTLTINTISPNTAPAGSPDTLISIIGTNFTNTSAVRWSQGANSTNLISTYQSSTFMYATISAQYLLTPGVFQVAVVDQGNASNTADFTVRPANVPTISALSPNSALASSPATAMTVTGTNFVSGSAVQWTFNGQPTTLTTQFISGTQLSTTIPASLLTAAGTAQVVIVNPGNAISTPVNFTINPSMPTITSLNPASLPAGSPTSTLTVNGTNFVNGASVRWTVNSQTTPLTTQFVNSTQLTASIPASFLANAATAQVLVANPTGSPSAPANFNITNGTPTITSLSPNSLPAGSPAATLGVTGTNFASGASVRWTFNGQTTPLTTQFVSSTQLTASVPANLVATAGQVQIVVANSTGSPSSAATFNITSPIPGISSLSPPSLPGGSPTTTLTLNGANFLTGASVRWTVGTNQPATLTTQFVSAAQLTASIPASMLTTPGAVQVVVINPSGSTSAPANFTIGPPAPAISSLAPNSITALSPNTVVTVNGTNFVSGAVVRWTANNQTTPLTTTFGSSTRLTATVPANLLAIPATAQVTVANPTGSPSASSALTITPVSNLSFQVKAAATPSDQPTVGVTLSSPPTAALTGTLVLSFTPAVANLPAGYIDPAALFTSGSTTVSFTVPAGQTTAIIPDGGKFSQGTVAGILAVTVNTLNAGSVSLLPSPKPSTTVPVVAAVPVITPTSVKILNVTPTGFVVEVQGFSNTRQLTSANYTFTPASGGVLDSATSFPVPLGQAVTASWFDTAAGRGNGSRFAIQMPFTYTGDPAAIGAVSVTLTNSMGDSAASTGSR